MERFSQVIEDDSHSTCDDIIAETSLSYGIIERIINDCLKTKKVTSRWIAHQPNDEQKQKPLTICCENLAIF
ncbi:unnamed protein product [Rotaria sp. Silwood2]|nr:unnamed protein product [Rotaria sp. Silwood2]CAF3380823.1 unnamed protein product [Rotaria sp. Silwood2]CAF4398053.1 unnamed protein product [Rotaria sp. Silwood2]CAF4472306.1 unnamed protein product [Rotaria sp. Silwood2]